MKINRCKSILKKIILICLSVTFVFAFPYSITKSSSQGVSLPYKVFLPYVQKSAIIPGASCATVLCYFIDSNSGSDSNLGTSADKPWKTLSKIGSMTLKPGTSVKLKRGSVWNGKLRLSSTGQSDKPIIITAYGVGNAPVLANPGDTNNDEAALSLFGSYYVIDNVKVQDSGTGINIWSDHNIVQNSEITNTAIGIDIHGQYNLITHSYLHDTRMVVDTAGTYGDDWGANGINIGNAHNEISYNNFVNCEAHSYDYGMSGGALEIWQNGDYTSIHHNHSYKTDGFIEVSSDGTGSAINVTLAYNLVVDSTRFTYIHLDSTNGSRVQNFRVENNTLVDLRPHSTLIGNFIGFDGNPSSDTYYLINNIIYISDYYWMTSYSFTHQNNIYYFLNSRTQLGFTPGTGELVVNPQFEDLPDLDFHLKSISPAIDRGVNLGFSTDLDGTLVPGGKLPDLGAFEYK